MTASGVFTSCATPAAAAGRQKSERSEFFGLDHLLFEPHALGNVVEQNEPAEPRAVLAYERSDRSVDNELASAASAQTEFVDPGNGNPCRSRRYLGSQIRRQHFLQAFANRVLARHSEQTFKLRIPRFDAVFEIDREHSNVERLVDILAEV